jgi:tetratricopeptide (TPR) repeat protein
MSRLPKMVRLLFFVCCLTFKSGFSTAPGLSEPNNFWVSPDPPKSHYIIDARIDPLKGTLDGKETIEFKNASRSPIAVLGIAWTIGPASMLSVSVSGRPLEPVNPEKVKSLPSPLLYALSEPLKPGKRIKLEVNFHQEGALPAESDSLVNNRWYPRLWWDGRPVHDSYSVKIDAPSEYALAASGRLDPKTGRYEAPAAKTFGVFLGKNMKVKSREVEGVLVTTVATEKGAQAAAICLDTACDVIKFAKAWLGFYPFPFLTIIPGGTGRWGGYPVATGIVAIHGQETYKEGEPSLWWKWITAHEIGHEYWGEWVLDPDDPAWVWIAMGIFLDTEYLTSRKIDPERRSKWMGNFLNGLRMYYDLTVDIPPAQVERIRYDHNNTVIHSKCPSIIFALDSVLGRPAFEKIYKKCLVDYGGKRLGWKDFQRVAEQETGQSLAWFFDQWVRSNGYLCYKIEGQESKPEGDGYLSTVTVRRLGTMKMPIPVRAVFEDGSTETKVTERTLDSNVLVFKSKAKLKEAILDPEQKLARLDEPLPPISDAAAKALAWGWSERDSPAVYQAVRGDRISNHDIWYRLGTQLYGRELYEASADCFERVVALEKEGLYRFAALGWLGLLRDLRGRRTEAIARYREALKYDTGESMQHDQYHIRIDKNWLEDRLKKPFSQQTTIEIPARPTADELVKIIQDLDWTHEGKTPLAVYEKTRGLKISDQSSWLKLGLLLYDSGYYAQSLSALETLYALGTSELYKFTALVWMGHLMDLQGKREKALEYYQAALKHDPGVSMTHSQYGMTIDRRYVEERLKTPFVRNK